MVKWKKLRAEIENSPVTLQHFVQKRVSPAFDIYFKNYPDHKKYQWFIDICTNGTPIYTNSTSSAPERLNLKANPAFTTIDKLGIGKQILKWRRRQWIIGPLPLAKARAMHLTTNMLFAVPKPDGTSRPILNLADKSIWGFSVNDILLPKWCTVEYIQQLEIIELLRALGPKAWLWAKDLEDGYYNISIRREDIAKLAFVFDDKIYLYQVLPMGLASSPKIFNDFMHFPLWAIKHDRPDLYYLSVAEQKIKLAHFREAADISLKDHRYIIAIIDYYLDDILGGHRSKAGAMQQWHHSEKVLRALNLKTKAAKGRPPCQIQIWLGKEYNTIRQWVRLSDDKYIKYSKFLKEILDKKRITIHTLQKLVGRIRYVASIYRPLNAWARGLEKYIYSPLASTAEEFIITKNLRRDLLFVQWALDQATQFGVPWDYFAVWNQTPIVTAYTDASLLIGVGGFASNGLYFQQKWTDFTLSNPDSRDIIWKELAAIHAMISALRENLGDKLQYQTLAIFTDNEACKWMLMSMSSRLYRPDLQVLINDICRLCIKYRFHIWIQHVEGKKNIIADALSRFLPVHFPRKFKSQKISALPFLKRASALASNWEVQRRYLIWKKKDTRITIEKMTPSTPTS